MRAVGKITENFTWYEAERSDKASELGINNQIPVEYYENVRRMARKMEEVRKILGVPLIVTSWYRCYTLNRKIGGSATSAHMRGLAVDFKPKGLDREEAFYLIAAKAAELDFDQLIDERTKDGAAWIHLGLRAVGAPRREIKHAFGKKLGGKMTYTTARVFAS